MLDMSGAGVGVGVGSSDCSRQQHTESETSIKQFGTNIKRHCCLYETQPAYVEGRPFSFVALAKYKMEVE